MDSFARAALLGALDGGKQMDFILLMCTAVSVIAVCVCISAAANELRGIRTVLETHTNLEPVKVRTYQRRDDGGAQL